MEIFAPAISIIVTYKPFKQTVYWESDLCVGTTQKKPD